MDIDRPVAPHAHPHCHALFKIEGDDTVFEVDGRGCPMSVDTAVLVNAWQPHSFPFVRGRKGHCRVLALYIEPAWMAELQPSFRSAARRDFFREPCIRISPTTLQRVRALAEELGGTRPDQARSFRLLQELVVELALFHSRHREISGRSPDLSSSIGDHRIRKAVAMIAERATERFDADAVAREVALSRAHFFELFREALGVTPNTYRNVLRMELAYRALVDDSLSVGRIAGRLGFSVHADFTRFFRANHGISPDAYRRAAWLLT